jgi:predicted transport protein
VLRNRPPELVAVYNALEKYVKTLGPVELVARDRYVLFRTKRIFADVVVMAGSIRLAIHLSRAVEHALFSKVVADQRHVTHVALLQRTADVAALGAFLREAYTFSQR